MDIQTHLAEHRLLAVVTLESADLAVPLAQALLAGGVNTMELTLRTPAALDSIRRISAEAPDMTVGAGTVLTRDQADAALAAGASFAVSPSVNRDILRHTREIGLPFSPGVMTPTDIDIALQEDCHLLKFFPATSSGGLKHLRNIATPYRHLGVGFVPLGGINQGNLATWLEEPLVTAVGGSWLAPSQLIDSQDWPEIKNRARTAISTVKS